MNNYGEAWAYWYLRLNGFFPLGNFVVHKDAVVRHRADVDLLGVRPPHVFEEVGGQQDDWDPALKHEFDLSQTLAWICEVKTGRFDEEKLFRPDIVGRAVMRLGLVRLEEADTVVDTLRDTATATLGAVTFAKVLFSAEPRADGPYLNITEAHIDNFVEGRIRRYPYEKYKSRMFFPSDLFQDVIRRVYRQVESGG
ncbi:hypothetical protein [Variovorax atrisoli]|uniref:hypothetical protein n=1 Tax=Variovorax atrisoli TaxID=3394203 RepID=UPI0040401433